MSVVMKPFLSRSGKYRCNVPCFCAMPISKNYLNLRWCTRTCLKETSHIFRQDSSCSDENRFGPLSSASETLAAKATLLE